MILRNKPSYCEHRNLFEIGISDFHLQIVIEPKIGFQKYQLKVTGYCSYSSFGNAKFHDGVNSTNLSLYVSNFKETILNKRNKYFKETMLNKFDKYAPMKQKYLPVNKVPFMTMKLHREIMKRSRVVNDFLRTKS